MHAWGAESGPAELDAKGVRSETVIVRSVRKISDASVIATAILDRLLHHSTTLNIASENYRLNIESRMTVMGAAREHRSLIIASTSNPIVGR